MKIFEKNGEKFIVLQGANIVRDDEWNITECSPRGEIVINIREIVAFYDHTVIVDGHKIRVMETTSEILQSIMAA